MGVDTFPHGVTAQGSPGLKQEQATRHPLPHLPIEYSSLPTSPPSTTPVYLPPAHRWAAFSFDRHQDVARYLRVLT